VPTKGEALDPPSPEMSSGQVENCLPKRAGEGLLLAQGVEPAERPEERLLHEVLGHLTDACQHIGEPERPEPMGLVQLGKLVITDRFPLKGLHAGSQSALSPYGCSGAPEGIAP
jgi:hypothetical protein